MKRLKVLPAFLIIIVSTTAFAQNNAHRTAIAAATKAANDESLRGHIEKNVNKICAVYAEDAILLPPGGMSPITGSEKIREYYTNALQGGSSLRIETKNISYEVIDDNHAQEVGSYVITYKADNAAESVELKGYTMIAWERNKKGQWKIKLDMWH